MRKGFAYIRSELKVEEHPIWGASIELLDYEHFDYIDDVLTEFFDVEYSFRVEDEAGVKCRIYFGNKASTQKIQSIINQINKFHKENGKEFDLPSGT